MKPGIAFGAPPDCNLISYVKISEKKREGNARNLDGFPSRYCLHSAVFLHGNYQNEGYRFEG